MLGVRVHFQLHFPLNELIHATDMASFHESCYAMPARPYWLVEFVRVDNNVASFLVFVARYDLIALDLSVDRAAFPVLNAAVALVVQLVQVNLGSSAGRGIGF
jgi:hypothetical protein